MAVDSPEGYPIPNLRTPEMEALFHEADNLARCRANIQEQAIAFAQRPFNTHARKVGDAVGQWLHAVHGYATTVNAHKSPDALDLMVDLFIHEDEYRVAFLNRLTDGNDFNLAQAPASVLRAEFGPEDEDEVIDVSSVMYCFSDAAEKDFERFAQIVMQGRKGVIAQKLNYAARITGEAAFEVGKMTFAVWFGSKLLGFERKRK